MDRLETNLLTSYDHFQPNTLAYSNYSLTGMILPPHQDHKTWPRNSTKSFTTILLVACQMEHKKPFRAKCFSHVANSVQWIFCLEVSLNTVWVQFGNKHPMEKQKLKQTIWETKGLNFQSPTKRWDLEVDFNSIHPFQQQSHQPCSFSFLPGPNSCNLRQKSTEKQDWFSLTSTKTIPLSNYTSSHDHGSGKQDLQKWH